MTQDAIDIMPTTYQPSTTWAPLSQRLRWEASAVSAPKVDDPARLNGYELALRFILAGNAYFTIRSKKTSVRYTYRVSQASCRRCGEGNECTCAAKSYFVSVLDGPDNTSDYVYIGMVSACSFKATKKTFEAKRNEWPSFKAFYWFWERMMIAHRVPETVEVWHEGRCGRCGRSLTVPESIASGLGPVCAGK